MIPKAIPMEIRYIVFLLGFFILYVIFGGFIFMLLEWPEEQIKRTEIDKLLNDFNRHIKKLNNQTDFTEQNFRFILHELLVAQDNNLIDSYGNTKPGINWSFINSFFFAITVITTIGYGHLTPSTVFGKIFCIIYALFGIPITSLLIGSVADRFSKLYSPKKIRGNLRRKHYHRQLSARLIMLKKGLISLVPWFFVFLIVPAMIFRHIEHWSFLDGFYYCFITLSTIGFGDFVAGSFEKNYKWIYKIIVVFWMIFGLAYLSMVLNFITNSLRSRHISNVVQSLRSKIHSNGSFVSRMRRHQEDHCHPSRYKRQQSSPDVIYNPNDANTLHINDNNNFMKSEENFHSHLHHHLLLHHHHHHLHHNHLHHPNSINDRKQSNPAFMVDLQQETISVQKKNKRKTKSNHPKIKFSTLFKILKSKKKHKSKKQQKSKSNKNSLRCAYEEQPVIIRQTNSLPELSEIDCIDPCCSVIVVDNHPTTHDHQIDHLEKAFGKITIV